MEKYIQVHYLRAVDASPVGDHKIKATKVIKDTKFFEENEFSKAVTFLEECVAPRTLASQIAWAAPNKKVGHALINKAKAERKFRNALLDYKKSEIKSSF